MRLGCVVTAVNENPLYLGFVPMFINAWKKCYPFVSIKIILIMNEIPSQYSELKDYFILFRPIENISTAFTSQFIRLLYPCILNCEDGIVITDMDMIPMNTTYFIKPIENIGDDKFVYMRNVLLNERQISILYNIALPETWSDIFKIKSIEDIRNRLQEEYKMVSYVDGHNKSGWFTDQRRLYKYVMDWNKKTNKLVILQDKDTGFNRLNRGKKEVLDIKTEENIKKKVYVDYHCFRPYEKYKEINDNILNLL